MIKEMGLPFKKLIDMDSNTNEVVTKLKFIGKINKGDKINVRSMCMQPNNWFTTIVRTLFITDNRESALTFIESIINRAFEIIKVHRLYTLNPLNPSNPSNMLSNVNAKIVDDVICDLNNAVVGIENLKITYETDVNFCCKLETLVQNIETRMVELNTKHVNIDEVD